MQYISQINAYWNWVKLNALPSRAGYLYFAILDCANTAGWKREFNAPNSTLQAMAGLDKNGLTRYRNILIQQGLIKYKAGDRGATGKYEIVQLYDNGIDLGIKKRNQIDTQVDTQTEPKLIPKPNPNRVHTIDKDKDKCKNAIKNSFESARMHITEYIVNVIAKNNINDNKDNIVDNIKTIINAEFYNTYNTLSMYTINGINVATILKEQWKNDLIDNTIKLVYNSKLDKETKIVEGIPIDRESSIKAFVTIMYGCNNFCTYCVVPYVRGRERSRKSEDILNEIKDLVSKGYKEVTLLGQNVNSYGKGLEEDINFAKLLRKVNEIEGLERIRFMSSHPKDLTEEVIMAVKECDKVCEQIHLPVQSGSDTMLKVMNRHYTREKYLSLINKIKEEIPECSITTDIIVGFPGESEEDIQNTIDLVKEVKYDSAFTFIYSRRNHTPADKMENQIPEDIKHERFNRLVEAVNENVIKGNKFYEGKTVEVLVEGTSKNDETKLMGRTRNGRLVNFSGDTSLIGKLVNVKIYRAQPFSLLGEIE